MKKYIVVLVIILFLISYLLLKKKSNNENLIINNCVELNNYGVNYINKYSLKNDQMLLDSAIINLEKSLKCDSLNMNALFNLTTAYGLKKNYRKSLECIIRMEKLDHDYSKRIEVLSDKGQLYYKLNIKDSAIYFFQNVLKISSENYITKSPDLTYFYYKQFALMMLYGKGQFLNLNRDTDHFNSGEIELINQLLEEFENINIVPLVNDSINN